MKTNMADFFNDEGAFDPVACEIEELDRACALTTGDRQKFLEGVRHARIILRAATNNFQSHTVQPAQPLILRAGVAVLKFLAMTAAGGAFIAFSVLWASLYFSWIANSIGKF
jgi:hypothetical protein